MVYIHVDGTYRTLVTNFIVLIHVLRRTGLFWNFFKHVIWMNKRLMSPCHFVDIGEFAGEVL